LGKNPHLQVAEAYVDLYENLSPAQRIKRAEDVLSFTRSSFEGHFVLAKTAIFENFTGIAKVHLDLAILSNQGSTPKLQNLKIKLDSNPHKTEHIPYLSGSDKEDKTWQCKSCATLFDFWDLICNHCDEIDTIIWQSPSHIYNNIALDSSSTGIVSI
jgi:hypothetical protein